MGVVSPRVHDQFFKRMMADRDIAISFLQSHLPAQLLSSMNFNKLDLIQQSFIASDNSELIADVVFQTEFNRQLGYISVLIEHQRKPELMMPFRILKYIVNIMDTHLKQSESKDSLPLVYPIVLYNGSAPYPHSLDIADLIDAPRLLTNTYLLKPAKLIDLTQLSENEMNRHNYAGLIEACMSHHIKVQHIVPLLRALKQYMEPDSIQYVHDYVVNTKIETESELKSLFEEPGEWEHEMLYIEKVAAKQMKKGWRQGLLEGRQEGRDEGREEERYLMAGRLMQRFGDYQLVSELTGLPVEVLKKIT